MPQDSLFFRVLRRFNVIWVALLGLVLIVAGSYDLYAHRDEILRRSDASVREEPIQPLKMERLEVRDAERFPSPGTESAPEPWIYTYGHVTVPEGAPVGPDDPIETANLMVIDANGTGHWLFADSKRTILRRDVVRRGVPAANTVAAYDMRPIEGVLILVSEGQSREDKALLRPDALYLWKVNTDKAVKLIGAAHVLSYGQIGEDRYRVVYNDGKNEHVALYTVPEFEKVYDKILPTVPQ
jgi:hypothetical protein